MSTKRYSQFDDLITFTRASGGTYLDSDGLLKTASNNIPRIEYDSSGNRLGLLIEESRTNLLPYSASLANWSGQYATVTSGYTAPDGSSDACLLSIPSTGNDRITETITATSTSVTLSVFVKAGPNSNGDFKILLRNATTATNLFNTTLTITDGGAVGSGWYRHDLTASSGISAGNSLIYYLYVDGANTVGSDNYFWGAQLEAGSFPTSYIPTSGATTTRSADYPVDISFNSFGYNDNAGTFVVEFSHTDPNDDDSNYLISGGGTARFFYNNAGSPAWATYDGVGLTTNDVPNDGTVTKVGIGMSNAGSVSYLDGTLKATSSAVTPQGNVTYDSLAIGGISAVTALNGHIKSIRYYPRRLTNAQLVQLTS